MSNIQICSNEYSEILFWKVYRNTFIRKTIFSKLSSNVPLEIKNYLKYYLGYRIQFCKLDSLEWFIKKNEFSLLKYFLSQDKDKIIVASDKSIRLLFSKCFEIDLLSMILLSNNVIINDNLDLFRIAIEFNNKNALLIIIDEKKVRLGDLAIPYLRLCKNNEIFEIIFNQLLIENSIDIHNHSKVQSNFLKSVFNNLLNVSPFYSKNPMEILLNYSSLIDMTHMIENSQVFFGIGDLETMKRVIDLDIYKPREISNCKISIKFQMKTLINSDDNSINYKLIIDKLLFYLNVLFKYHLRSNKLSIGQVYENQFNEIKNYLKNNNTSVLELEFKYVQDLINILEQEKLNFNLEISNSFFFSNGLIFTSYSYNYGYFSNYENISSIQLIFETLNLECLKEIKIKNIHPHSMNLDYKLQDPIDEKKLIEFIKYYIQFYRLPDGFIKLVIEKCDIQFLNQLSEIIDYSILRYFENTIFKIKNFEKIKWYLKLKSNNPHLNNNIQSNYLPFCLNSIDEINFIKGHLTLLNKENVYPNFNSLQLLIHFSNNLNFNCIKDFVKLYKGSNDKIQTILIPWIDHLINIKFKCFNFNSFRTLILNLLQIFESDSDFIKLNIQFKSLSQFSTFLFITSVLNFNQRLLNLLINHYKIIIDYEFLKQFSNLCINKIYKGNHNLDEILQISKLLFKYIDNHSDIDKNNINLLKILFNNLYQRVLTSKDISLKQVLQIKNIFLNNGIEIIDSKINTHLYLAIKSTRFQNYIITYIDPAAFKIENTLTVEFKQFQKNLQKQLKQLSINEDQDLYNNLKLKENLLHSSYSNDLSLENIINFDFDNLFIKFSKEIKNNINQDFQFLLKTHSLNLLESILKSKKDNSCSINYDLNILNQIFSYGDIENILLELKRINK